MSEAVTVTTTDGTPTLSLNDGGTATYSSGSGTKTLTFSYTVGAAQNTSDLTVTAYNAKGGTITNGAGTAGTLTGAVTNPAGTLQIDTTTSTGSTGATPPPTPTVSSVTTSGTGITGGSGDLGVGKTVTFTVAMNEAVTVTTTGGTPTLSLNDGGTATYSSGSGTNSLTFSYTVGAGQNTSDLTVTAYNAKGGTITNGAGTAATMTGAVTNPAGTLQIDTTTSTGSTGATPSMPTISSFSPTDGQASGGYADAHVLTITGAATANSKVEVFDGSTLLGTASVNGGGAWSYTTPTLSDGAQSFTAKDVNAAGNVSAASAALSVTIVTAATVTQVGSNYDISTVTVDPVLKYAGANVTAGQFGGWMPIAAVLTTAGYDVAWRNNSTGQYTVWTTDKNGNYTGNLIGGAVSGNSYALKSLEPVFQQDLNGDGAIGTTKIIQIDGSTSLTEVTNQVSSTYYLNRSSGSDPALKYQSADVTTGEFGSWMPIGAVQTTTGYDVAWQNSSNQYTVWTTDNNGNYTGNLIGAVSGNSYALESLEPAFQQDLNGDGAVGVTTKIIQTDGSTSLTEVANQFYLDSSSGSGPALKYQGADVTAGELGSWMLTGAVQTTTGYDIAWQNKSTAQYTVWTTDSSGNYTGNLVGAVSGNSAAFEIFEPVFQQDLNGDGIVGIPTTIVEVASKIYLDESSGSDPSLKYNGVNVTVGELGSWTPIAAARTASGYEVAAKNSNTGQYTIGTTDSNGNYTGSPVGGAAVAGNSYAFESAEPIFGKDLNGDGVVGLYASPSTTLQISNKLTGPSGSATIGAGATLELSAADSASVTFSSSTGTLRLDHSSTFTGDIFGFTGNGKLSGSDQIDLKDIKFGSIKDSFANGVLTVTDSSGDTANLNFNGSYTLANFKFASDGSGGTIVYDPPVTPSSGLNAATPGPVVPSATTGTGETPDPMDLPGIAFNVQSTLGYLPNSNQGVAIPSLAEGSDNANIALMGNYMASIFATASDNHGTITTVAEAARPTDQSVLSSPHHA